jgi:hypothetical protein
MEAIATEAAGDHHRLATRALRACTPDGGQRNATRHAAHREGGKNRLSTPHGTLSRSS